MAEIKVANLSYRYQLGGVRDASFTIPDGQIACLLGPSGSGKTTLLKLLAGFLKPQAGQIFFDDKLIASPEKSLIPQERQIGLVFQQHALFPHLTVDENILFGCQKKNAKDRESLLDQLLEDFKISQHKGRYPHQISGGEQQRVAIARALASEPKLLLMDEPFSSLDKHLRDQVQQQCVEIIRAQKLTTLMVTHDEESARAISDLIIRF